MYVQLKINYSINFCCIDIERNDQNLVEKRQFLIIVTKKKVQRVPLEIGHATLHINGISLGSCKPRNYNKH